MVGTAYALSTPCLRLTFALSRALLAPHQLISQLIPSPFRTLPYPSPPCRPHPTPLHPLPSPDTSTMTVKHYFSGTKALHSAHSALYMPLNVPLMQQIDTSKVGHMRLVSFHLPLLVCPLISPPLPSYFLTYYSSHCISSYLLSLLPAAIYRMYLTYPPPPPPQLSKNP